MNLSLFGPRLSTDAWLVLSGGKLFPIAGRCTIGRQADNDLILEDPSVSRYHALIARAAAGHTITDLQSSNGTTVNGELIDHGTPLRDGDVVGMGGVRLEFHARHPRKPAEACAESSTTHCLDTVRRRECWFLVADVDGYATLNAREGPETAVRQLQSWFAAMRPLLQQHGARISSYVGDSVFAYWACENAIPEQVLAALAALESWRPASPLPFRFVVHHGVALATKGEHGEELRGRDVSFVFRTEKIARGFNTRAMLTSTAVETLGIKDRCESFGRSAVDGMTDFFVFYALPPDLATAGTGWRRFSFQRLFRLASRPRAGGAEGQD